MNKMDMSEGASVYVGRQPILNRAKKLYAYELLYRNSNTNKFPDVDPEQATISLLITTFMAIGVDRVSRGHLSFINFSADLLSKDFYQTLDPRKVVIEVLEDVEITPSLLTRLRQFKREGFRIALDDFIIQEQYLENEDIFKIVDIIKVDFSLITNEEHAEILTYLKRYPNISLLAEKIETEEQFKIALDAGYSLFQGYFFAKPEIIESADIPSNTLVHFEVMREINKGDMNIEAIANLIMRDVSLSYKMLRYINSLAFAIPRKISSIKQALVLIGMTEARRWLQVLLMNEMSANGMDGRTKALVDFSLSRAKICELFALEKRKKNAGEYFMVGMFSQIDVLMRRDMPVILPELSFSEIVADTIAGEETEITPYLQLAIALERFEWDEVERLRTQLEISEEKLTRFSQEANRWSQTVQ